MTLVTVLALAVILFGLVPMLRKEEARAAQYLSVASASFAVVELVLRRGGMPRFLSIDLDTWLLIACSVMSFVSLVVSRGKVYAALSLFASTLWLMVETRRIRDLM